MAEYAMLVALIAVVAYVAYFALGDELSELLRATTRNL
jgi:Flp pilus assembly pilin Flp